MIFRCLLAGDLSFANIIRHTAVGTAAYRQLFRRNAAASCSLQADHDGFYFIADYHAMTSLPKPDDLAQRSLEVAMDYIALGLDIKKTVFWRQSDLPEVASFRGYFRA